MEKAKREGRRPEPPKVIRHYETLSPKETDEVVDAAAAGELRATLEKAGTPVGAYDLLIAAQALTRGATLVSANAREFARVPGLKCQDWAAG
ncbi:MAG: hypothetical protein HY521_12095 [Proteobacteria bacterium]|nr:hypothetical protein [Pseudomonadota bacterium]